MRDTVMTADWAAEHNDWPLEAGERVLWQGQPSGGIHIGMRQLGKLGSGTFGLILFIYLADRLQMQVAPYWDVWVVVLAVFFASIPADIFRAALMRRRTSYALTDRRALVALDIPLYGRLTRAFPILPGSSVDVLKGRRLSSISFTGKRGLFGGIGTSRAGFERIADGDAVFALIGRIQRGAA